MTEQSVWDFWVMVLMDDKGGNDAGKVEPRIEKSQKKVASHR